MNPDEKTTHGVQLRERRWKLEAEERDAALLRTYYGQAMQAAYDRYINREPCADVTYEERIDGLAREALDVAQAMMRTLAKQVGAERPTPAASNPIERALWAAPSDKEILDRVRDVAARYGCPENVSTVAWLEAKLAQEARRG